MTEAPGTSAVKERTAPDPEDPAKPDKITQIEKPSWKYTAKAAFREFMRDGCTDHAAALTYYSVLSLFPGLVALISLLGVFGQGQSTVNTMLDTAGQLGVSADVRQVLEGPIQQMVDNKAAGFALVTGLLAAIWSASGYVGAFSRVMNRIYEVDEGRPFWKLRPLNLLLTVITLLAVCLVLLAIVISGPVATTVADSLGLGQTGLTVWAIAKWVGVLIVVVAIVALLYFATPNVQQPKFRWISVGAVIAILTWIVASLAFGFYVSNFGKYNKTYGSLAGVVVFLLWLWLTNLALLFGAEVDSELERVRQLQGGIEAEETLQLPPRDTRGSDKAAEKEAKAVEEGRQLRLTAGKSDGSDAPDRAGSRTRSRGNGAGRTSVVTSPGTRRASGRGATAYRTGRDEPKANWGRLVLGLVLGTAENLWGKIRRR